MSRRNYNFDATQLNRFDELSFELIPLHSVEARDARGRLIGKAPIGTKWRLAPALSVDEARAHMGTGGNVGVRLRPQDLVIDVDPRNFDEGDDPVARLEAELGVSLQDYPTVVTGSGGKHIYMTKPVDALLRDTLEAYPGVEFKCHGRQVVAPGSVHPGLLGKDGGWLREPGGMYHWDDDPLAPTLAEVRPAPDALIEIARRPARTAAVDAGSRSPDELEHMLDGLDPCQFREHSAWLELMMACHHATGGEGRDQFIAWSTGDPQYGADAWTIGCRWDSLHADQSGRRVTEKTLFKALVDAGRADLLPRESAAEDFQGVEEHSDEHEQSERGQRLSERYVWIVEAECFVRRNDVKRFSATQFKSFHADEWHDGDILNAVWKGKLPIRKLESLAYLPWEPEFVRERGGGFTYNTWRDHSVEPKPGDVSVFVEHLEYLFPDKQEREYALDYLALLVRRPAVKINFALLVRGKQGTGKSWLGTLAARIIGEENVSRPNNSVVLDKYTDWQQRAQLAIIEELMAPGRQEVANRLKPVITDDFLCIRPIYAKHYLIPNRLNLMCFTNHADALPIEPSDRRWLVLFSDAKPKEEAYYERLFDLLNGDGPAAVAHWLSQRTVNLNPKGVAPMTTGKQEMRGLSQGEAEQYLEELRAQGAVPFDFALVRLEDLLGALPERITRHTKGIPNRVSKWLKDEVGAVQHERYKKGGRPAYQLWSICDHEHWSAIGAAKRCDAYLEHQEQA